VVRVRPGRSGAPRIVLLIVGAVLATLLIVSGILSLLGQSPGRNSLIGVSLDKGFTPLPGARGGTVRAPWRTGHGTVLLFFAKWCAPCHAELPKLAPVAGTGRFGNSRVIGIDGDQSTGSAASFVSSTGVRFPVGVDDQLQWATTLVPVGFPASVVVSASGVVLAVNYGALSPAGLRSELAKLG